MGEAKARGMSTAQSWTCWLTLGERWEIRNLLLMGKVASKDAKARVRAIAAVDDPSLEPPYGLGADAKIEWETAANARLLDPERIGIAVTSENAAVILDAIDAALDAGQPAALMWRLRHTVRGLEAIRRGEPVDGLAVPLQSDGLDVGSAS